MRSRLYFDFDRDGDTRKLKVLKSNYGRSKISVDVRWQNGVYVPIAESEKVARAPEAVDQCFLALLERYNQQERWVGASRATNYAPTVFARDPAFNGFSITDLTDSMNRLFDAKAITVRTEGPPSRQRKRIVRV